MKRFTDTTKWDDPWFIDLCAEHKTLWLFLCDKCDNAGVVDFSLRVASFLINGSMDLKSGIDYFIQSGRIKQLENGKYFILNFVKFQFGDLSTSSNLHKSVLKLLKHHKIDGYIDPSCTHHEGFMMGPSKGKGKGKGKGKEGGVGGSCEILKTPTIDQVINYAKSPQCGWMINRQQAENFINHYESIGWTKNGNPIKKWQPLVIQWKNNQSTYQPPQPTPQRIIKVEEEEQIPEISQEERERRLQEIMEMTSE